MAREYPEPIYWLALSNASKLKLNLVKPIIQQWCFEERRLLSELFDMSPLEWSTYFGLSDEDAEYAARSRDKLPQQAATVAQWQAQNIEPIIRTDPRYPRRLLRTLPAVKQPLVLWARGTLDLLNEPGVAVLSSQTPAISPYKLPDDLLHTLFDEKIGLISGYGRGLDRATFETMLTVEKGWAVTVLPMGLNAFAKSISKLETAVASGKVVLVSPFTPDTPFQEKLAEARNLLIDHLALALLIPQADEDVQERAIESLRRGLPVFVGLTNTAGNRNLIEQGALLLTDPGEVIEMAQQAIIDDVLLDEEMLPPITTPVVPSLQSSDLPLLDSQDDFALHGEEVEPIDSDEALEILSLGGNVPEILRQRLKKSAKSQKDK